MSLQKMQFNSIMRDYDRKQLRNRHLQEERISEIFTKIPRVQEIHEKIVSASAAKARALLRGESDTTQDLKEEIRRLSEEKKELLHTYGYPEDYMELAFDCPLCQDTGFVNGEKCSCFKKATIHLLYDQSNIQDILEKENFQTFSFDYYSDRIKDEQTGKTPLEHAQFAVRKSLEFIRHFRELGGNLFIYGDTGVGKTFLTHCIARELILQGYSVLYFSAYELFEHLANEAFSKEDLLTEFTMDSVCDVDLLIIDDLGTELTNTFVKTRLFSVLNERILHRKSTVISTNHDIETFSNIYSTRIFSRVMQNFTLLNLIGKDIRVQKALGGSK